MKNLNTATRIAFAFCLVTLVGTLAAPTASAGLFHRRTVIVESPTVYVTPAPTVYAAPVTTVYAPPVVASPVVAPPIITSPGIDSAVVPSAYVPTVSTGVVSTPVTTTYIPTVTTVPSMIVEERRFGLFRPRRVYLYGY
jgi:hypothetical protein